MSLYDDPDSLNFEATYEFINEPINCIDIRKKTGFTGEIRLAVGDVSSLLYKVCNQIMKI